ETSDEQDSVRTFTQESRKEVGSLPAVQSRAMTFPTTRRSIVLALGSADAAERTRAFDVLVALYWKPLYKYLRVARGRSVQDAEDLTQSFLAHAFEKGVLTSYDAEKGTFRTFLRTLFDRFVANEAKARMRL